MEDSSGWEWDFYWIQHDKASLITKQDAVHHPDGSISVSEGGDYSCRGQRGQPVYFTKLSDKVTIDTIGENLYSIFCMGNVALL